MNYETQVNFALVFGSKGSFKGYLFVVANFKDLGKP